MLNAFNCLIGIINSYNASNLKEKFSWVGEKYLGKGFEWW